MHQPNLGDASNRFKVDRYHHAVIIRRPVSQSSRWVVFDQRREARHIMLVVDCHMVAVLVTDFRLYLRTDIGAFRTSPSLFYLAGFHSCVEHRFQRRVECMCHDKVGILKSSIRAQRLLSFSLS